MWDLVARDHRVDRVPTDAEQLRDGCDVNHLDDRGGRLATRDVSAAAASIVRHRSMASAHGVEVFQSCSDCFDRFRVFRTLEPGTTGRCSGWVPRVPGCPQGVLICGVRSHRRGNSTITRLHHLDIVVGFRTNDATIERLLHCESIEALSGKIFLIALRELTVNKPPRKPVEWNDYIQACTYKRSRVGCGRSTV